MSLDNIQLPPLVVADLFKNVLIDLKTTNDEKRLRCGFTDFL